MLPYTDTETVSAPCVTRAVAAASSAPPVPIHRSELVAALSYALDLTEGQPLGHSLRTCLIGLRLAQLIGLPAAQQSDLYYALLLKDAGCSSNAARLCQILGSDEIAAKAAVKTTDWTRVGWESLCYGWRHVLPGKPLAERLARMLQVAQSRVPQQRELVQIRCDRGARIALKMGFSEATAEAIHSLDEHWNGRGYPQGLQGEQIPLLSRILNISQTIEVYFSAYGREAARDVVRARRARWFDPAIAKAADHLFAENAFWETLAVPDCRRHVVAQAPDEDALPISQAQLDDICEAFADVIDAKSPYTYQHSHGVAAAAVAIAQSLGLDAPATQLIRRAALLHDLGKLSVPSPILEKAGQLTPDEWAVVRRHPYYSQRILSHIAGFAELSQIAGAHHEKLDGSGYWRGLNAKQLSLPARILAVADVYDALAARRPYRDAMPPDEVMGILTSEVPRVLDGACVESLHCAQSGLAALARAAGRA